MYLYMGLPMSVHRIIAVSTEVCNVYPQRMFVLTDLATLPFGGAAFWASLQCLHHLRTK